MFRTERTENREKSFGWGNRDLEAEPGSVNSPRCELPSLGLGFPCGSLIKNANFSDPQTQTFHIRNSEDETQENVFLNRPPDDSDAHSSLRITGLDCHNGL